jgi:hypothetical protein
MKFKVSENSNISDNYSSSMQFYLDDFVVSPQSRTYEDEENISIQLLKEATLEACDISNNNLGVDQEHLLVNEKMSPKELDGAYDKDSEFNLYAYQKESVITELKNMMSMVGNDSLVNKFLTLHLNEVNAKISFLKEDTEIQKIQPVRSNIKRLQNLKLFITSHRNKVNSLRAQIREQGAISKREIQELTIMNDQLLQQSQLQLWNFNNLQAKLEGYKLNIKLRNAEIDKLKNEIKSQNDSNDTERQVELYHNVPILHLELDERTQNLIQNLEECIVGVKLDLQSCNDEIHKLKVEINVQESLKRSADRKSKIEICSWTNQSLELRKEVEKLTEELYSSQRKTSRLETEKAVRIEDKDSLNVATEFKIASLQGCCSGFKLDIIGREIEIEKLKTVSEKDKNEIGSLLEIVKMLSKDVKKIDCTATGEIQEGNLIKPKGISLRLPSRLPSTKNENSFSATFKAPFRPSPTSKPDRLLPLSKEHLDQQFCLSCVVDHLSLSPRGYSHSKGNPCSQGEPLFDKKNYPSLTSCQVASKSFECIISEYKVSDSDTTFSNIASEKITNSVKVYLTFYSSLVYFNTPYSKFMIVVVIIVNFIIVMCCCI